MELAPNLEMLVQVWTLPSLRNSPTDVDLRLWDLLEKNFSPIRLFESINSIGMLGQQAQHFLLNPAMESLVSIFLNQYRYGRLTPREDKRDGHASLHSIYRLAFERVSNSYRSSEMDLTSHIRRCDHQSPPLALMVGSLACIC